MGKDNPIKAFSNGMSVEFTNGRFDSWLVRVTKPNGEKWDPTDADYFSLLKKLADDYGVDRVYDDFVEIYDVTGKAVSEKVLSAIDSIAEGYGKDSLKANVTFTLLYLTMLAEENRKNTKLGRRIKRLGAYELLKKERPLDDAMSFMKDMFWREIADLCEERGF